MTTPNLTRAGDDTSQPVIRAEGLSLAYRGRQALKNVDLHVPAGALALVAGPNGAGKTTLLRALLDLTSPAEGVLEVMGRDPRREGAHVRAMSGHVPSTPLDTSRRRTVHSLLREHARYFPRWDAAYAASMLSTLGIASAARVGELPRGASRCAQLVMALAHRPRLIVLDEPLDGLDHASQQSFVDFLSEQIATGETTVVVASHQVDLLESLATHACILDAGSVAGQYDTTRLRTSLHRYRASIPAGWAPPDGIARDIIARWDSPREIEWLVWGASDDIAAALTASGAMVSRISPLRLDDAIEAIRRFASLTPVSLEAT